MTENNFKQDRRSIKTRRAVKLALLKLLKTKPISSVTIKELTAQAGINRNSFYTHYKNIDNIFDDINCDMIAATDKIVGKYSYSRLRTDALPVISDFSAMIESNKVFTEYLLFSQTSSELLRKLKDSLVDKFYALYLKERANGNPYIPYMISFLVSGVTDMYYMWFRSEKNLPLSKVTENIAAMIEKGLVVMREIKNAE